MNEWRRYTVLLRLLVSLLMLLISACSSASTRHTLQVKNAKLDIDIETGLKNVSQQDVLFWIKQGAEAVTHYYKKFPLNELTVKVVVTSGRGVKSGKAMGFGPPRILLNLGSYTTKADLSADWVIAHEMVHLAFPSLAERHGWLLEGMATYIEPIARYQAEQLPKEKIWQDLIVSLPKGLPKAGDRGLDNTPTWGRTYWGGALYCLLADIRIRQQTKNRFGLRDALIAVLDDGGDITKTASIDYVLAVADKKTGVAVMTSLYVALKDKPGKHDLQQLWRTLGVSYQQGIVSFSNKASLAEIREAIVSK